MDAGGGIRRVVSGTIMIGEVLNACRSVVSDLMIRGTPRSTPRRTLFPSSTLFRADGF